MEKLTRRYVYDETYAKIMEWAKESDTRSPNMKENFAHFLSEYVKELELHLKLRSRIR